MEAISSNFIPIKFSGHMVYCNTGNVVVIEKVFILQNIMRKIFCQIKVHQIQVKFEGCQLEMQQCIDMSPLVTGDSKNFMSQYIKFHVTIYQISCHNIS